MDLKKQFKRQLDHQNLSISKFAKATGINYDKLVKWMKPDNGDLRNKAHEEIIQNFVEGKLHLEIEDKSEYKLVEKETGQSVSTGFLSEPPGIYNSRYVALLEDDRKNLQQNLNQALEALNVGLKQLVTNSTVMSESQIALQAQVQASIVRDAQRHVGDSPGALQEELTRVNKLAAEAIQKHQIPLKNKTG